MKGSINKYNDRELLKLVNKSSKNIQVVFEEIYDRYSDSIYRFATYYLNSTIEAKDIHQDVFINYYNQICKIPFEIPKNVNIKSYLLQSTKNRCINKIQSRRELVLEDIQLESTNIVFNNYENTELREHLKEAIEKLEPIYREAFILKEIEGLTFKEVGIQLNISLTGAQSRVVRAKEKLVSLLEPYLGEEV